MKALLPIITMIMMSCGYDGSVGRLKDDLTSEPKVEKSDSDNETASTEAKPEQVASQVPEKKADADGVVLLTEKDFVESCTPGSLEGDFAVSVEIDGDTEFQAFFDEQSACNHSFMSYSDGVAQGGVCSNEASFVLFDAEVKAKRLVLTRSNGQITWEVFNADGYERLQYLTIKDDFEGSVTFCKKNYK